MPFDQMNCQPVNDQATLSRLTGKLDCDRCPTAGNCLVNGCGDEAVSTWRLMARMPAVLREHGDTLFEAGDNADTLYVVRTGCIKTFTIDQSGTERVRNFYLPGDIVGLDALETQTHRISAAAVTPSQVCAVPLVGVLRLMEQTPLLMRRLTRYLSEAIASAEALSGDYSAEQRIAAFLLRMHRRLPKPPSGALQLPMTRRDIANHLRLATETVSRVLTRFTERGAIRSERQRLHLLDMPYLGSLADAMDMPATRPLTH